MVRFALDPDLKRLAKAPRAGAARTPALATVSLVALVAAAPADTARIPLRPIQSSEVTVPMATRPAPSCAPGGACTTKVTSREMVRIIERMVLDGRFQEARPLLTALAADPSVNFERQFLEGYVASQSGDQKTAIRLFRSILQDRPKETRVRLELARALYIDGQPRAADHHFRLAEDAELPEDVRKTVQSVRRAIQNQKSFYGTFELGIAPDTNVNSATSDRSVELFGLPFTLSDSARQRTGIGQTASLSGGAKLKVAPAWAVGVEVQGFATNYVGVSNDDYIGQVTVGPQWTHGPWRLGIAGTATERWYGGKAATRLYGARLTVDRALDSGSQIGLEASVRRVDNLVTDDYDGVQTALALSYERVVNRSLLMSFGVFGRYEPLAVKALSSTESGVSFGIGGELPWGINAGVSAQGSRVWYADTLDAFGVRRNDWRLDTRAYAGLRSVRIYGFSPSLEYRYTLVDSTIGLYSFNRHRFEFTLASYF